MIDDDLSALRKASYEQARWQLTYELAQADPLLHAALKKVDAWMDGAARARALPMDEAAPVVDLRHASVGMTSCMCIVRLAQASSPKVGGCFCRW